MAEERTLRCDRCGSGRNVDRIVLELGTEAAWVIDACNACKLEMMGEISALTGADLLSPRNARAARADYLGNAPYTAAAGLSLTEVRSWAQRHDIPVSGRGRINSRVLDLYRSCQEKGDRYLSTREAQRIIEGL